MRHIILVAVLVFVALGALWTVSAAQENAFSKKDASFIYSDGSSSTSGKFNAAQNFNAALNQAISKAHQAANSSGADMMLQWSLDNISGRRGGIAGLDEVVVSIKCPKTQFKNNNIGR